MSTNDVPGYNPANSDQLAMGCWAEHEDKSLIFVESVEAGRVVYSLFDLSGQLPLEFRDAMTEAGFKRAFSWPNDDGDKWTWHDKTPFPWDRVMGNFPSGTRVASAPALNTAAKRVAQRLGLHGAEVRDDGAGEATLDIHDDLKQAKGILKKLQRAIKRMRA